jgi:O-antigen/teichoic acid export membrane protein
VESSELKHKTFHAVIWTVARIGATNLLSVILFAVLARVLSPRDVGVFALAILVVDVARVIASAGLSDAVTRDKRGDAVLADTAFWANLGLGCIVGGLAWLLAPLYARLIDQPEITGVLRALAVLVPVSALSGIHTARKLREFGHKAIAARAVACGLLGGTAAIAAALAGWGVWSLVVQAAIVETIGIAFAWQAYPWCPRLRFDIKKLTAIGAFSGTMLLTQVSGLFLTRIQDVVIGRYISVAAVGSYRIAWRMIELISQATIQPIVTVSFVTLAHLQDDKERFSNALLRMVGLGAILTLPALSGFGVLSGDIIPLLFGAKWASSAAIAQVLSLMAVPFCINYFLVSALAAIGRPGSIAKSTGVQTVAALGLSLLAAPFGVQWVAAAYVLRAYLMLPYHLHLFRRDTGVGLLPMMRAVMPPFLASQAMVGVLLLAVPPLHEALGHGVAFVAVAVLLGGTVFVGALLLFAGHYVRSNLAVLMPLWRKTRPRVVAR